MARLKLLSRYPRPQERPVPVLGKGLPPSSGRACTSPVCLFGDLCHVVCFLSSLPSHPRHRCDSLKLALWVCALLLRVVEGVQDTALLWEES